MKIIVFIFIMYLSAPVSAGLVISEIACTTAGDDWVELFYNASDKSSIDISKLFVTMYYGTNEPLAEESVTLYSYDRPETPYDDRCAVVHLTAPGIPDETDRTGDTNKNGYIDIYCNNYTGSLWNAECAVALDTNDDPSDGMFDFAAWSDNDGSPSDTILGYCDAAVLKGQWLGSIPVLQSMLIPVPAGGIKSYQSLSRKGTDSNAASDFEVTQFQTPGRPNKFSGTTQTAKLFTLEKEKITVVPGHPSFSPECILNISEACSVRMRVFSDIGQMIFDSGLIQDCSPGQRKIEWKSFTPVRSGLYIALIEATASSRQYSQSRKIFFIVTRYK
jgi:hypothetical protein